ncbi:MAG TPA: 4Fe-4S dicluster domain-containing protein [Bryobacteraceae bacterium]|nr:4Fe-4S dicluster domain-containing protein [Bryobacteraceae bacterium]
MSGDRIEELGIVGAGGGGFPAAVKFRAQVATVIVNAAECEPLLHKDKELLLNEPDALFAGLRAAMDRTNASAGIVGIKEKYSEVIAALERRLPAGVRIFPLKDVYPAGDEFVLVHDVTGRVIPPGGLPKDAGVAVANVETLVNIGLDRPVTHKYLTVAGAVAEPVTLRVPVGVSFGEVIAAAGGATVPDFGVLVGGVMMGRLAKSLADPVTKTTGGLIVLPADHSLVRRHSASWPQMRRRARSACDQCRMCSDLCPRRLLGHPIEPHRAMRALGFAGAQEKPAAPTLYCSECNLCSVYSCPEQLDPKGVCAALKPTARELGMQFKGDASKLAPHPLAAWRRTPTHRLMRRLDLLGFRNTGPLEDRPLAPRVVVLPLKQHAGAPAVPVVNPGERVRAGDLVAAPAEGALGARIHASIDGVVRAVEGAIRIEA